MPNRSRLDIGLGEIWNYRNLVLELAKRDLVSFYKQTILGPIWLVIQPLMTTSAYTLVFNRIAGLETGGVPPSLFYLAGVVLWTFFSSVVTKTSNTFVANAGMFGKIYFPRIVVPVSAVITNLATFGIQFVLLVLMCIAYGLPGGVGGLLLAIPLVVPAVAYVGAISLGIGAAISAMTTRFRDLTYLVAFAIQLWMFVTPVIYPLSSVPARWRLLLLINPMTAPMETFRALMLKTGPVDITVWIVSLPIGGLLVFAGLVLFWSAEKTAMDTV